MKRIVFPVLLTCFAVLCLGSCQKNLTGDASPEEIVLVVDDGSVDMEVQTKAPSSTVSSVPSSLYLARTTGTWKSETSKNTSASKNVSSGKINTGWYQTATATAYNYYLSNASITFASGGSTVSAANTTDVVAGCTQGATTSTTPSVALEHIFARTGTLTCNTQSGYSISSVSWKIQSVSGDTGGTKGTYNIATKAWSNVTALSSTTFTSSSDLYLTPGKYSVSVSYTLTLGEWSHSFTRTGEVTLKGGNVNNITCTATGGAASQIALTVTLTGWQTNNINMSFNS